MLELPFGYRNPVHSGSKWTSPLTMVAGDTRRLGDHPDAGKVGNPCSPAGAEFPMKYLITFKSNETQEVEADDHEEDGSYTVFTRWDSGKLTSVKFLSVLTADVRDIRESTVEDRKPVPRGTRVSTGRIQRSTEVRGSVW
jgi:hypothetical protein